MRANRRPIACAASAVLLLILSAAAVPASAGVSAPTGPLSSAEELRRGLDELGKAHKDLSGGLDALLKQYGNMDMNALDAEQRWLKAEIDKVRQAVADLEKRIDLLQEALKPDRSLPAESASDLEKRIADATAELQRLTKELEELTGGGLPPFSGRRSQEHPVLLIVKNGFLPAEVPYFEWSLVTVTTASGQNVAAVRCDRVKDGVPVEMAVEPGGVLDTALQRVAKEDSYVEFMVCADSIPAFRAAIREVGKRGLAYTWQTFVDDFPHYQPYDPGNSSGPSETEVPVSGGASRR
jgi:hypothetical protein